MLLTEGEKRSHLLDFRLAAILSGCAGAVNAAGFQATGLFSANQTGNASALSDHIGLGEAELVPLFAALVAAFIAGAFCSGLLIGVGRARYVRAIYAYCIAIEGTLLGSIGAVLAFGYTLGGPVGVTVGLSFAMGVQNGATTRISNARVRTTHVSGMATDIGLGFASLFSSSPDREAALARLKLYAATLFAYVGGGIFGVATYLAISGGVFIVVGVLLVSIALSEAFRAARPTASGESQ